MAEYYHEIWKIEYVDWDVLRNFGVQDVATKTYKNTFEPCDCNRLDSDVWFSNKGEQKREEKTAAG